MNTWFRMYNEVLHDPKVQSLSGAQFKLWVNLLCISSQASRADGELPSVSDIAFIVRQRATVVQKHLDELKTKGLLDIDGTGDSAILRPHNWNGRQFTSDVSTNRVERYRENRRQSGLPVLSDYSQFRPALLARDGDYCVYCQSSGPLVVDHVTPTRLGGTDDLDNLALACKRCNSGKAGRTPEMAGLRIGVSSTQDAYARYIRTHVPVTVPVTVTTKNVTVTVTAPDSDSDSDSPSPHFPNTDNHRSSNSVLLSSVQKNGPMPRALFDLYNQHRGALPEAKTFTKERAAKCKVRLATNNGNFVEQWTLAVQRAAALPFCLGDGVQGWKVTLDWLIANDTNYVKILEGKYDYAGPKSKTDRTIEAGRRLLARMGNQNRGGHER